ncbi:MAG: AI-2E family transporter [Armatimonadota bacterium]|nr:AI-2E family transporter [Armatimonadota bacterium]MDR7531788.1 AI-2E family transporter [Armatimonadota bacterium]MDR7534867.1 AI-2E family transporter [Armatimonadota bacterium]
MDRRWLRLAAWGAGILVVWWGLGQLRVLTGTAVVVLIITFPIYPLVDWLERRGLGRAAAAALVLLAVLAGLALGLAVIIPWIVDQVHVLIRIAPSGIRAVTDLLARWQMQVAEPTFPALLRTAWERAGETAVSAANGLASRLVNTVVGWLGQLYLVLLLPFIIYFVLLDYRRVRDAGLRLLPADARPRVEGLLETLTRTLRWGLWAQVVVSAVVGGLTAVGLALAGVPGPLAIGLFAGVAEAVPYIGGFATYAVALLAAIPQGGAAWMWAVVVVTAVKLLSNVLVPLVLGKFTQTHPLAIIAALLALGQLFGLVGMFFAVPVVVIIREVLAWWQAARAT